MKESQYNRAIFSFTEFSVILTFIYPHLYHLYRPLMYLPVQVKSLSDFFPVIKHIDEIAENKAVDQTD